MGSARKGGSRRCSSYWDSSNFYGIGGDEEVRLYLGTIQMSGRPSHHGGRRPETPASTSPGIYGPRPPGAAAANHTLPRRDSPSTEREEPRCSPSSSPP